MGERASSIWALTLHQARWVLGSPTTRHLGRKHGWVPGASRCNSLEQGLTECLLRLGRVLDTGGEVKEAWRAAPLKAAAILGT